MKKEERYNYAIELFDKANSLDPNLEMYKGKEYPRELLYARRLTNQLSSFEPQADETVRLAARCQHIERWKIPRNQYDLDKKGYFNWRNDLKLYHASKAREILEEVGYGNDIIDEVELILLKKKLKRHENAQLLEDVVCLVFLEFYFEAFSRKHEKTKLLDILRKTWAKMSEKGREKALKLNYDSEVKELIDSALSIS